MAERSRLASEVPWSRLIKVLSFSGAPTLSWSCHVLSTEQHQGWAFLLSHLRNRSQPSRLMGPVGDWTSLPQSCPALAILLAYYLAMVNVDVFSCAVFFVLVNTMFCIYSNTCDEKDIFVYRALIYVSLVLVAVWHRKWALTLCLWDSWLEGCG